MLTSKFKGHLLWSSAEQILNIVFQLVFISIGSQDFHMNIHHNETV